MTADAENGASMTQATYPADVEFLGQLNPDTRAEFQHFMAVLDGEHEHRGSPYGEGSLWQSTGGKCWWEFFEDGYTPAKALAEDLSNAY